VQKCKAERPTSMAASYANALNLKAHTGNAAAVLANRHTTFKISYTWACPKSVTNEYYRPKSPETYPAAPLGMPDQHVV
jgi:hypothetical protein